MRETAILRDVINGVIKPGRAIGRVTIDLLDPITGKVRNRVSNPNHVFEDALFSGSAYDWITSMSGQYTLLTDNNTAVDEDLPFVLGNIVAYGIPSQASSGTYRGAYNAANQVLAAITTTSARWKFQYDFTTAQANGTIKCAGLSNQYVEGGRNHLSGYRASPSGNNSYTNDGRYTYVCSTAGVITKYDILHASSTTIDVSATTGTTSSTYKFVGYAPSTRKYYIYTYSSTTGLRYMYAFSDNTFTTLENTYSASNIAIGSTNFPFYVYGNYAYFCTSTAGTLWRADFIRRGW